MISLHQISKIYGNESILENVSFNINKGDRIGLIGPNGCGKTTLLRMIAGLEQPDRGIITKTDPKLTIGYLPQGFEFDQKISIGEHISSILNNSSDQRNKLEELAQSIASDPENDNYQRDYDNLLQLMQARPPVHPSVALESVGLGNIPQVTSIAHLSGGQKTKLSIAHILLTNPHLLLLDEPTNHLDIQMLEWLENWIADFSGAALIVSHDRTFLDRTVHRIFDIDPNSHTITEYRGNYSDYLFQYIHENERQMQAYRDEEYEIRRMKQDIAKTKRQANWVEQTTTSRQPSVRRIAKKVAKKAKSREKKLDRFLESEERVSKPNLSWQMKLEFDQPIHQSQIALALDNLSVGYKGIDPLIKDLTMTINAGARIVLTGPNGGGKTTLLRTIAGKLSPLKGSVSLGGSIRIGYMTQEQESIPLDQNPIQIIQHIAPFNETEARSFLHYFLFSGDEPLHKARVLSYGERSRLALAILVAEGSNLLVLDEPINHLDIPSRARFEQSLSFFEGTILAVIHDRYFISRFATEVWVLQNGIINQLSPDQII